MYTRLLPVLIAATIAPTSISPNHTPSRVGVAWTR